MASRGVCVRWLVALACIPVATALSDTKSDDVKRPSADLNSYFGNAGCAASGCHNANGPRGSSGSEYSTWANEDPHAQAYSALLSDASQRMVRIYRSDKSANASTDALCLKCHAPLGVDPGHSHLRTDAVGCEACHGAAQSWRTTHYQRSWKEQGRPGMANTKDLTTRIAKCVECHVGKNGMEVDHDLIASGHPRLFFEYSAYHELLPRHWQEQPSDTTFHARAWAIGRVASAKAAVELLHDRAAEPKRWPELAEFNCYACHQDLTGEVSPPKDRKPGSLAAGSWSFALLNSIASLGPTFAPPQPVEPESLLKLLHDPRSKAEEVAAAAKSLAQSLETWHKKLGGNAPCDVEALRTRLAAFQPADWEQATQHYLALAAVQRTQAPSSRRDLSSLRKMLTFPVTENEKQINSPVDFKLTKYVKLADIDQGAPKSVSVKAADALLVTSPGKSDINVRDCKNCHSQDMPDYRKDGVYDRITVNPAVVWAEKDPHAVAWKNLLPDNPIARRMSEALGYDVSRKPECLTCHAVDATPFERDFARKSFSWNYGVGCEACHGDSERWFDPHRKLTWPEKSFEEKAGFDFVNLRDPATRAAKCASCHVGNVAEGKFVTHEMYAAGHPSLLPFEPVTFSRDQPQHWQLPSRVKYFQDHPERAEKNYHVRRDDDYGARSVAVGAIINLRESVKMLKDATGNASQSATLDFAHFDCYACHHKLVLPSERQLRSFSSLSEQPLAAGRPMVRSLPVDFIKLVTGHNQAESAVGAMQSAFAKQPYGNRAAIHASAVQLIASCEQWLGEIDQKKFDAAAKEQLLAAIVKAGANPSLDYENAQQLAWAARALKSYDHAGDEWKPLGQQVLLGAGLGVERSIVPYLKERRKLQSDFDARKFAEAWKQVNRLP